MTTRYPANSPFNLCALMLVLACSQEKQRQAGEPTPFDLYVASQRLQGRLPAAIVTSPPRPAPVPTGDADHDFLREMSNHHKSVIVLADAALEVNTRPDLDAVIRQLEERHGHELDAMTGALRRTYKDGFISLPSSETKLTANVLRRSGSDYRRIFLDAALKAEEEGVRIAAIYQLRTKRTDVDQLAGKIRTNETRDLIAIRNQLASADRRR